jgi:hypothetical protein
MLVVGFFFVSPWQVNHVKSLPHFVQKNGPVTIALINSGSIRANIEVRGTAAGLTFRVDWCDTAVTFKP